MGGRFSGYLDAMRENRKTFSRYAAACAGAGLATLIINLGFNGSEQHDAKTLEARLLGSYPSIVERVADQNGDGISDFITRDEFGFNVLYLSRGHRYIRQDIAVSIPRPAALNGQ